MKKILLLLAALIGLAAVSCDSSSRERVAGEVKLINASKELPSLPSVGLVDEVAYTPEGNDLRINVSCDPSVSAPFLYKSPESRAELASITLQTLFSEHFLQFLIDANASMQINLSGDSPQKESLSLAYTPEDLKALQKNYTFYSENELQLLELRNWVALADTPGTWASEAMPFVANYELDNTSLVMTIGGSKTYAGAEAAKPEIKREIILAGRQKGEVGNLMQLCIDANVTWVFRVKTQKNPDGEEVSFRPAELMVVKKYLYSDVEV